MMIFHRCAAVMLAVSGAIILSGCATPKQKTAPCRHPSAQTNFAEAKRASDCVPKGAVNPDRQAALSAIEAATAPPVE